MKKLQVIIPIVSLLMILVSCEQEGDAVPAQSSIDNVQAKADKGRPKTMIWSDGLLFESVVTPAVFDGDHGNYDRLFAAGAGTFQDGVGLISESKPGDQDYNGGRWDLYVLKESVDPNKYASANADGDLDINDFNHPGMYFECPLLPRTQN